MLKCNKNNYKYKKTIIIMKSTDISLDRQASSASVIRFEKQKKESFWIRELQTLHPEGINKKA